MSNQATQGSVGSGAPAVQTSGTNAALMNYLMSNEDPLNAQMIGSTGTVNTALHTTHRANQQILNVDEMVPSNDHVNTASYGAAHQHSRRH